MMTLMRILRSRCKSLSTLSKAGLTPALLLACALGGQAQMATPVPAVLVFAPAVVGATPVGAQTLTASFSVPGSPAGLTAALHFGLSYTLGALSCTGTVTETCTVPVTFKPAYPGARPDAIFLMNGNARLATMLLSGVGQGPLSLMQPGLANSPILNGAEYYYNSTVDENGTDYVVNQIASTVTSITTAGVVTVLPITGLNRPLTVAIDGAGVLFIADQKYSGMLTTYDTVRNLQGTFPSLAGGGMTLAAVVGSQGQVLETDSVSIYAQSEFGGNITSTPISPSITQADALAVDSAGNLFIGGYQENLLTPAGIQTQINQIHAQTGYGVDAADTLYIGRGASGPYHAIGMLPASNGWTALIGDRLDGGTDPLGLGVGGDGTIWVGNYQNVDRIDRSQGAFVFNAGNPGYTADPQIAYVYNGGNQPLTLTSYSLAGDPNYTLSNPATTTPCTAGMTIAAGGICGVTVNFTAPGHGGVFTGTLTFYTNSLNTSSTQNVSLLDNVYGAYVVPVPATLNFGNQTVGTTSAAQIVTFTNDGFGQNAGYQNPSNLGSFSLSTTGCNSVAVGASCTGSVTFSPTATGNQSATPTVYFFGSPTVTLSLNGTGTLPAPIATLAPSPLAFGNQIAGTTSAVQPVTLSNTGSSTLNISNITLTGNNTSSFGQNSSCGMTLNAGTSCTISVTFHPATAGSYTAQLTVADDATGSPQTALLSGTGVAPAVTLSPASLAFTTAANAAPANQTVTLTNTGTAALTIASVTLGGTNAGAFTLANNGCGASLAAGTACTIAIGFPANAAGNYVATLTVTDNASPSTQTVQLTSTVTGTPGAAFSPTSLNYTTVANTQAPNQITTLTNTGTAALTISSVTITGTNAGSFLIVTNGCGTTLAAGANCAVTVGFTSIVAGTYTATLTANDNATSATQTVALTGTVTGTPVALLTPSALTFSVAQGTTSTAQQATLSNTGTAPLAIASITLAGANGSSFGQNNTCGTTLAAGASCNITVTFSPANVGVLSASLNVADNSGSTAATQTTLLTGTGTAIAAPQAALTPLSASFSAAAGTTTAAQVFALTNAGTAALPITSVSLGGTNASSFTLGANTCGASLAAGATCTASVTFTPAAAGTFTATLSVVDSVGTQSSALSGVGTATTPSDFSLTPTPAAQTVYRGTTATYSILAAALLANNPYPNPVSLSVTGLPPGATASFSPATVVPGAQASTVLTVNIPALSATANAPLPPGGSGRNLGISFAFLLGATLLRRRNRPLPRLLALIALCGIGSLALSTVGCGSGTGFAVPTSTYSLVVTGTSGTTVHSTTVKLTVQ